MSIDRVIAELLQVRTLVAQARAATESAVTAIDDGAAVFNSVTDSSQSPLVSIARSVAAAARTETDAGRAKLAAFETLIDDYCNSLANRENASSHWLPPPSASSATSESTLDPDFQAPGTRSAALVAELLRTGTKISPTKVVRITRLPDGRIVWLETGSKSAGLKHILAKTPDFERTGTSREAIVDLVFTALTQGKIVGYSGSDRPVYEVEIDGEHRRVAISVGDNGFIVGAHPLGASRPSKTRSSQNRT